MTKSAKSTSATSAKGTQAAPVVADKPTKGKPAKKPVAAPLKGKQGKPAKKAAPVVAKRQGRGPAEGNLASTSTVPNRGRDIERMLIAASRKGKYVRINQIAKALPKYGAHGAHVAYLYAKNLLEREPNNGPGYRVPKGILGKIGK